MTRPPEPLPDRLTYFRSTYPESSATVQGAEFRYVDTRVGESALLFLPGGTGEAEPSFDYIVGLADAFRVIAIRYPVVSSMDELADAVAGLLEQLGVGRVHVWGTSFGGTVAQRFALRHPNSIETVVLSNSAAPEPARAIQLKKQSKLSRVLPGSVNRSMLRRAFGRLLATSTPEDRAFWESYLDENVLPGSKERLRLLNSLSVDFHEKAALLEDIGHPWTTRMLIIEAADSDPYAPSPERLHRLYPDAQVISFEADGHASTVSQASRYVETVKDFLTRR